MGAEAGVVDGEDTLHAAHYVALVVVPVFVAEAFYHSAAAFDVYESIAVGAACAGVVEHLVGFDFVAGGASDAHVVHAVHDSGPLVVIHAVAENAVAIAHREAHIANGTPFAFLHIVVARISDEGSHILEILIEFVSHHTVGESPVRLF